MKVICFGDSNTFGYDPRSPLGERYDAEHRWVDILAANTGWEIRNNGMNGREIPRRETVFSKSADVLIIMLGSNDLLQGNPVNTVTARMEHFLTTLSIPKEKLLLVAPPAMIRGEWVQSEELLNACAELADSFRALSMRMGIAFADAGEWKIPIAYDGVHFTEDGHRRFAQHIAQCLKPFAEHTAI